jgi:formylglycine-generating enzyme required for sulfatase activity
LVKISYFESNNPQLMVKYVLVLIIMSLPASLLAQDISHMNYHLEEGGMSITYDLNAQRAMHIEVFYQLNSDSILEVPEEQIQGEAGIYVEPGRDKGIQWSMATLDSAERARVVPKLRARPFIEMVPVKGGTYQMGCTPEQKKCDGDEKPAHRVSLDDFAISRYEITNAQYAAFLNQNDIDRDGRDRRTALIHIGNSFCQIEHEDGRFKPVPGKADHPVVEVTWNGAQAFCQWAGGRLPTEAEWEYAARGGPKARPTRFSGSNQVDSVAWYDRNARGHTHPVGSKQPNELGLYDMSGNVWEWCFDWYDEYPARSRHNPTGPERGENVVVRGGSWLYYGSFCRVSNRGSSAPDYAFNNYGFRLVRGNEL